jgi:hypothetical protein
LLRRTSDALACATTPIRGEWQIGVSPATLRGVYNSAFPLDRNNGSLWAGRGLSGSLTAGIWFHWEGLTASFAPSITGQQNSAFPLVSIDQAGYSPFIYPSQPSLIDWPQRFGAGSYSAFDVGDSFVRYDTRALALGISNENLWLGPAVRSPLLLSNTAAGFPHVFLGTQTVSTPVGRVAAQAFWGRLDESDYFDDDDTNNARLLSGLALGIEPKWTPGLIIGYARLYTARTHNRGLGTLLARAYGLSSSGTRSIEDNSIFALYARYVLPAAGAEVYAEWGHEIGYRSLGDLLREPDQTQAYLIGFDKITGSGENKVRVYGELTHLDAPLPLRAGRGVLSFYTHAFIRQGHTQRGQLLGAWIGPGSNAQIIGVDLLRPAFSAGLFVERTRFDADAYYNHWGFSYGHNGHDAELAYGIRNSTQIGDLLLALEASYGKRYNRMFRTEDGRQPGTFYSENNANIEMSLSWWPRARAVRSSNPVSQRVKQSPE